MMFQNSLQLVRNKIRNHFLFYVIMVSIFISLHNGLWCSKNPLASTNKTSVTQGLLILTSSGAFDHFTWPSSVFTDIT